MLVGSVALIGSGWALGYAEGVVVGGTGVVAVVCAVLWVLPRPRMTAHRSVSPAKLPRGDAAESVLTLVNRAARARRVVVEDYCDGLPITVETDSIARAGTYTTRYPVPVARRGVVRVGPLTLVRQDPAGLARRTVVLAAPVDVLVRPRVHPLPMLSAGRAHHIEGPDSYSADDGSQTFHTLRNYVTGDDLRRVHWRSSARTGELMVRQMVDASLPHTSVVLDTRRTAYPGPDGFDASELAVDIAASVACAALAHGFPLRLVTDRGAVPLGAAHTGSADQVLDALAVVPMSDGPSLDAAFDDLEQSRVGGTLVVVTGLGEAFTPSGPARLKARFDRVVLVRTGSSEAPHHERLPDEVRVVHVADAQSLMTAWRREAAR